MFKLHVYTNVRGWMPVYVKLPVILLTVKSTSPCELSTNNGIARNTLAVKLGEVPANEYHAAFGS